MTADCTARRPIATCTKAEGVRFGRPRETSVFLRLILARSLRHRPFHRRRSSLSLYPPRASLFRKKIPSFPRKGLST